jgi:diguanylate cyclase (GGDEF)-like protein
LEAWVVEYSRNVGRLIIVWRWVLFLFVALDVLHPSEVYTAVSKAWMGIIDPPTLPSAAALGLLLVWTVIASALDATWNNPSRPFAVAAVDAIVAIAIVYTQRTLIGPMLFSLPVLEMFASNVMGGGAASFTMLVIFAGIILVKSGARPDALMQAPAFWFFPFLTLAALLGFVHQSLLRQESQTRALVSVIETSQELGTSASLEKILQLVTDDVKSLFDCSTVVAYLKDTENPSEPLLRVASVFSPAESFTDFNPELAHSIIGHVMKEKRGRVIDDFEHYQPEEAIKKDPALRSSMVAPLLFEEQALGVVFIAHNQPSLYNENLFRLFAMLANQVALAVRNVQLHKTTEALAITDSLSGLFTHGYFQEHLGKEVVNAKYNNQNVSLMIIDVDFFKKVNDSYGHPQGDALLKQLGGVIKQVTRPTDVVCRYGGDEFTVTMLNTNRISAVVIAERIRQSVEDYEFVLGNQIVHITVSGGVASFPEDAQTKKELIEKADKAMYESKHKGRNCISFSA